MEPGSWVKFGLEPGDYRLSLVGPPPSGCYYSGGFTSDNSCDFKIESDETTVISLVDDQGLGEGNIFVGC